MTVKTGDLTAAERRRLEKELTDIERRLADMSGLLSVLLSLHDCPDCGEPLRGPPAPGCPNISFHRPPRVKRARATKTAKP